MPSFAVQIMEDLTRETPVYTEMEKKWLDLTRCVSRCALGARPAKSTGLPSRLLVFLTPSTGLLGARTLLLVLKSYIFRIKKILIFICVHSLSDNRLAVASN